MKTAMTALAVVFLAGAGPALAQDREDRPARQERLEQRDRPQRDGGGVRPQREWGPREAPQAREAPRAPEAVAPPAASAEPRARFRGDGGQRRDEGWRDGDRREDSRRDRGDGRRDWDGRRDEQGRQPSVPDARRDGDRRDDAQRDRDRRDDSRRDWDRRDGSRRDWDRRDDRRGDHRRWERDRYPRVYASPYRYRYAWRPPSGFYLRSWSYGEFFPRAWFGPNWWIVDPWRYDLPLPPPGYEWVRSGSDALLIDEFSGRIVQVVRDVFWY